MDESANATAAKPGAMKIGVLKILHNPLQLRVLLMLAIFGGWYQGFYQPVSLGIDGAGQQTERGKKRLALATDVERLRIQVDKFKKRLPEKTDPNEWVQYMMDGVRKFPGLRQVLLDTDGEKELGPFKGIVIKLQVEGGFRDVDALLRWIESNPRLIRVDSIKLEPSKGKRSMMDAHLVVIGVMG